MAQLPVTLSQGEYKILAMVLIQKNAPNGLLLGTDLQPALGFRFTMRNQEVKKQFSWEVAIRKLTW